MNYNSSLSNTFVQNHDLEDLGETIGNIDHQIQGYAFILSHPGVPTVFWSDYKNRTFYSTILDLIKLRREVGIEMSSAFTIVNATEGLYSAIVTGKTGSLAIALGTAVWNPDNSYRQRFKANNVRIWTK